MKNKATNTPLLHNEHEFALSGQDQAFLSSHDARGLQLQLDYLQAEVVMQRYAIEHTVVVFGSARIVDPERATQELTRIESMIESSTSPQSLAQAHQQAKSMLRKSLEYYEEARKFGRLVGESGKGPKDCRVTLMTGGGPGIMEAANRGAMEVGAKSIGLNIKLPREQIANPYTTPELSLEFHYFAMRKLHFMQRAKALVIFPGGFGTLDEFFEILTLIQTRKHPPLPIILIDKAYWSRVLSFEYLVEEGFVAPEDLELIGYASSASEAWKSILSWHERSHTDLF